MKRLSVFLFSILLVVGFSVTASATPVTVNGLTFSEQTGAFTIDGGSGTGTQADPLVLYETVTGLDVTMSIDGLSTWGNGNLSGTFHSAGFWLEKIVTNNTGQAWNFYDLELQEQLGVASTDGDGLSFAQGSSAVRPWVSNQFASVDEITDVRDYINFYNGVVLPGEDVTFSFIITDNSPVESFYLRQRPNYSTVSVPEPATLFLLGSGLIGLAALKKRKFLKKQG